MKTLAHADVRPDLSTMEGEDRFFHWDIAKIDDSLKLWSEEMRIKVRLAELVENRGKGQLVHVVDGIPVHERQWYVERLTRLHWAHKGVERVAA